MPDFMDEVRAEVRNQRFVDLFNAYRYHLLALVIVLVAGTGLTSWYKAHRLHTQQESGNLYLTTHSFMLKDDFTSALPRLNMLAENGTTGWKSIAMLDRASMFVKQKKYTEALDAYNELIADSTADILLRDMAIVMSAWLMMEHGVGDADTIEKRLESMRGAGKAWNFTATELLAAFEMKQGKQEKARALFKELHDTPLAPESIQIRAGEMLEALPAAKKEQTKE